MAHDLRLALRGLLKSPIFTVVTLSTLALGLGATTAIFSVLYSVLLHPLPVEDPDRVIYIRESRLPQFPTFSASPGNFLAWRRDTTSFSSMAAVTTSNAVVTGSGEPERIRVDRVTADLFPLLGASAVTGRYFRDDEDRPGANPVIVLSEGYWRNRFGGEPSAIGRSITLSGTPHTIIGVAPASLGPILSEASAWIPIAFTAQDETLHGSHFLRVYGRLKPGITLREAATDLDRVAVQLEAANPNSNRGWRVLTTPLAEFLVRNIRTTLLALSAAVVLVLLVVYANVASLTLARGLARQRELAVRMALGAERGRLVREMMAEGFALAIAAGLAGLLIAFTILRTLVAFGPPTIPRLSEIGLNPIVLAFAALLAGIAPLFFSLLPAVQASRMRLVDALPGGRTVRASLRARARATLVIGQIALAMMLLVGCALLLRSFSRLLDVDPGFDTSHAVAAAVQVPAQKYPDDGDRVRFQTMLLEQLATRPGVVAAGLSQSLPLGGSDFVASLEFEGRATATADRPSANFYSVSPGFFAAMGIRVVRGRTIDQRDRAGAPRVIVVNETFARRFYPGQDPIGQRIIVTQGNDDLREIVGIVGDTKHYALSTETPAQVYESYQQQPFSSVEVVVRSAGDPLSMATALRESVRGLDPDQPIGRMRTLESLVDLSLGPQRFSLALFSAFAGVALLLASVGLYGLVAYTVSQRTPEIGLRLALGARPSDVLALVLRQGMLLGAIGTGIGLVAAFGTARLMTSLLFQTSPNDTTTYVVVPIVLLGMIALASLIPARRASRVDPAVTLRS